MKKTLKRTISLVMCVVLLLGTLSISAFAAGSDEYKNVSYKCYTFIGDSISWGYGLDPNIDTLSADYIFDRTEGAFTDIVGKVLEENCGTEVHSAASSGGRLCDYRVMFDKAMGVENPYTCEDDWFGNRSYERTHKLQESGAPVVESLKQSDFVTLQLGMNDLAGALVNAICSCGFIDINRIKSISDAESALDYLAFALNELAKENHKEILPDLLKAFDKEFRGLRDNGRAVLKDVVDLTTEDADILILGYHDPVEVMRVIPNTDSSLVFDLLGAALASLNDYFADIASEYDNVYYVDVPDASVFFEEGTLITDALSDTKGLLLGLHPDAEGHEYIAERVLDKVKEINTCHHTHTKNITETVKTSSGFGYVSSKICTDCGKVLDMGKIITPAGTVSVPSHTINYTVNTVVKTVTTTVSKIFSSIFHFK